MKVSEISRRGLIGAAAIGAVTTAGQWSAVAAEPSFPTRKVDVRGYRLNVVDVGSGPAVVLLHGFPNSSADWRHQIPALVQAGYRVIAPDLLGLGKSDKPLQTEVYSASRDADRIVALMAALDIQRARIVGHDRGGGIAWNIAAHHPELTMQLVALTVGHSNVARTPSLQQRERSWYMLLFQFPNAEDLLKDQDWRLFRDWVRNHPDADAWIRDLEPEGALTAGLGWYRANRRPDAPPGPPLPEVVVPALGLWTMDDAYLLPDYVLDSYRYMRASWRTERIDGASHFMMLDRPDQITRLLLEFFREAPTRKA